ncbi:hypothetical protein GC163_10975 [bacterium]|nr:hypothetical protein [bacterium]
MKPASGTNEAGSYEQLALAIITQKTGCVHLSSKSRRIICSGNRRRPRDLAGRPFPGHCLLTTLGSWLFRLIREVVGMPTFEIRTEVQVSPETLFDFIIRPANMQAISPPEVGMVIVDAPEILETGSKLVFKVQGYGMVQQLEHEMVLVERPRILHEKMTKGPLPKWEHQYVVEPADNGQAALINKIDFEPPGGMLGMILTADRILQQLEESYAHRSEALKKALES